MGFTWKLLYKCNRKGIRSGVKIMHVQPVLKRLTGRVGDAQFLAFSHFLVNCNYYSNNNKRNEDYLYRYIKDDLKYPFEDTYYSGKLFFCVFVCHFIFLFLLKIFSLSFRLFTPNGRAHLPIKLDCTCAAGPQGSGGAGVR